MLNTIDEYSSYKCNRDSLAIAEEINEFSEKVAAVSLLAAALAGCISTQEIPLAPNMVRLDTKASGLLLAGQATNQTMRRAAELTLQNGHTHFGFEQASLQQGSQLSGVYSTADATVYGNSNVATMS